MNERTLWNYLRDSMKGTRMKLQRIESGGTAQGVPDVAFSGYGVHGWIELKYLEKWPVRTDTDVKIHHLNPYQKMWLSEHHKAGGHVFLLLRVGRKDFLLYDGSQVPNLGTLNKEDMIEYARGHWKTSINVKELCQKLTIPSERTSDCS